MYSSRISAAFEPEAPKLLRSAIRVPSQFQGTLSVSIWTLSMARSGMRGLSCTNDGWRGMAFSRSISMSFARLAAPDAASACPMLAFTDVIWSGLSGARPTAKTARIASSSAGSPACVPVPWHSTTLMLWGWTPERARRFSNSAIWVGTWGWVMESAFPD